ncbi:MAG: type II secretion system secretin GspD [Reinekea sp.]
MTVSTSARSVLLSVCLMLSTAVFSADNEQKYTLNMQEADIKEVIDLVAKVTGKTFIIDPRVRGKVTVVSDREMTEEQIYETFLATLEVYGFSAVEAGDVTKVIGQSDIKSAGIEVETTGGRVGEEIITRVFPIQNASAMELVPILRPLVAKYGHLAGVSSANVLIVADRATNIGRLSEIIHLLDKAGSAEIEVVQLQHAWVSGMITLLERISPTAVSADNNSNRPISSRTVQLVGDERSNRIIVKGEKEARAQIVELIKQLDTPTEENASFKVIFLNNADATKMAEILKGIAEHSKAGQGNNQGAAPSSPISILADEDQNALVVRAEPNELKEIEQLINQLDIPRQQVLIEAAIVEVSGSFNNALGMHWATNPEAVEGGTPFVSSSFGDSSGSSEVAGIASSVGQAVGTFGALGALTAVPVGGTVALVDPFGDNIDFGVILKALESETNTNLLSTPSVLTLDNNEAYITVGSSVPFLTGGSGTDDNPFTIERQDVGTTLTVIPHIQQNGSIRLEVDQSVENVDTDAKFGAQDLVTSKREVKTQVLVQSGSTIVLGGLISDKVNEVESRIPLLGSIPIIGTLFRSTKHEATKTNLMIILRPSLVEDDMDAYRESRLQGIWELRIQSSDLKDVNRPSTDDIFKGNYIAVCWL